jgi:lipopolysaccharide assembly outer membrane protein LptD (OstA)
VAGLLLWAAAALAAEPDEPPWDIVSRSTSAQRGADGTRIITFIDDVVVTHDELVATADRARYLEGSRRAILEGHVVMRQDSTVVRSPFAYYERGSGLARFPYGVLIERPSGTAVADVGIWRREENLFELRGRAAAADTSGTLDAETITYDTAADQLWALGDARMVDDVTGVIVEAQSLHYDQTASLATAKGSPTAVFTDDDDADVHVSAERMTYDPRTWKATAKDSVHIRRETMEATCGTAEFFRAENRALLTDGPQMVDGATVVSGERIEMTSPEPGRRIVAVRGAASVANRFAAGRAHPDAAGPAPAPAGPEPAPGGTQPAPGPDAAGPDAAPDSAAAADESAPALPPVPTPLPPRDEEARRVIRDARGNVKRAVQEARGRVEPPPGADTAPAPGFGAAGAPPGAEGESAAPGVDIAAAGRAAAGASAGAAADSGAALPDSGAAPADSASVEGEPVDDRPAWLKTPSDLLPQQNLLFGDEITLYFTDNELERVVVIGHGRSKFFPSEESGELTEWNDVVGDTLNVWFTASALDSVHVLGEGVGEYRFPAEDFAGQSADQLRSAGKLVDYRAPHIRYLRDAETMHLDSGAEVRYKTMTLTSEKIDFEAQREIMTASGDPGPVLIDKQDEIRGERMNYHLPSGKGEITQGWTRFDQGYYRGEDVWKMGDDVLAVDQAQYTTCDLDHPHYHFSCRNMKIYLDDKMVARPVVLKIRNIPVFALPFYMTSLRKHRHSGFLLPKLELGVDNDRGRFIRNMGYYWAPNDYMDLTATADFYPSQDQLIGRLSGRYRLRYRYQGSVALKYDRNASADRRDTAVEIRHEQDINETTRLTADASFLSSNSFYQNIDDENRLDRDLSSHATLSKRFADSRNLTVDVRRNENLDTGSFTETLPSVTYTQPSRSITGGSRAPGEEGGWLDDVRYQVGSRFVNQRRRDTAGTEEQHIGSTVDGSLSTTRSPFRYLRITPNANGEVTWIDRDRTGETDEVRATYRGTVTASTDLYGTFLRSIGPVRGFRHKISPSVSWNWAPEFREYFYVAEGDTTGRLQDRFFSFGGIRGTPGKTNTMGFNLQNLVQTKLERDGQERRYTLFQLSSRIGYDLLAEEQGRKPLSTLSNTLNVLASAPINQTWSTTHDPYTWDLQQTRVTTALGLSSSMLGGPGSAEPGAASGLPSEGDGGSPDEWPDPVDGDRADLTPPSGGRFTPGEWNARITHSAVNTPPTGGRSSELVFSGSWSPTSRWNIDFNYNYDLEQGLNTYQKFTVRRIIHCWELSFDRRLLGQDWQYYIRINVTDLPDIQLERGQGTSTRGFGTSSIPGLQ